MTRVLPFIVALTLAVYALIDCLQTDPAEVRGPRRGVWIVLILVIPVIGPVAWLIARRRTPQTGGQPARRPTTPPVAPDDNPEFLRQIRNIDEEHEQLLSQWEKDLRRREEEMRNRDGDDDESS